MIDLSAMNAVLVDPDHLTARILGGARASDLLTVTDPRGVAARLFIWSDANAKHRWYTLSSLAVVSRAE